MIQETKCFFGDTEQKATENAEHAIYGSCEFGSRWLSSSAPMICPNGKFAVMVHYTPEGAI